MGRPTKIQVVKRQDGYEITCVDEMTGSATGMQMPTNGYEALKRHFSTGAMEVSSDELRGLNISNVSFSEERAEACPKCGSNNIMSYTPMDDMCNDCGAIWQA